MKKFIIFLFILNISAAMTQNIANFESYIANFKVINSDTVSNVNLRSGKQISNNFIYYFVPDDDDCECMIESIWYKYASVIENDLFYIAFIDKVCDTPSPSGSYPYYNKILIIYSKEGDILDWKIISRGGDIWEYNYSGTWSPFMLQVEQAKICKDNLRTKNPNPCTIVAYLYTIEKNGIINEKFLSKDKFMQQPFRIK